MELLDRYQPLFVIGRGGMGTIEAAVERNAAVNGGGGGRVVALKRMLPGARDRRHIDMFLREARLATLLNHENVVHAFAFGEQDGELYIAMEYVEGQTLASLLVTLAAHGGYIPIDVTLYVLAALCDGLHAAHELRDVGGARLGVVHRDVSPHNVMLSYEGEVKLLDFGVAKLDNAAHLTKTGEVKGKTAYMSPEQAMGDPLDRRSDLYGVGATLFEMVAGRRMWTGNTDLELLRQLALAEPPKLSDVVPDVPRALQDIHARLVAKKAKDRFENAEDVAKALRVVAARGIMGNIEPRGLLTRLLQDHFAEQAVTKRHQLEAALARRDPPDGAETGAVIAPATSPSGKTSRVAPWMYAIVGAAVASVAVLGLARNRPATSAPAVTSTTTASNATQSSADVARTETPRLTSQTPPTETSTHAPVLTQPMSGPRVRPPAVHSAPAASTVAPTHPPIDVDTHAI